MSFLGIPLSAYPRRPRVLLPSLPLLSLMLVGCAHEPQLRDEPFGQSVRHMILVQTTDPHREPLGLDGEKALNALKAYRSGGGGGGGNAGGSLAQDLGAALGGGSGEQ